MTWFQCVRSKQSRFDGLDKNMQVREQRLGNSQQRWNLSLNIGTFPGARGPSSVALQGQLILTVFSMISCVFRTAEITGHLGLSPRLSPAPCCGNKSGVTRHRQGILVPHRDFAEEVIIWVKWAPNLATFCRRFLLPSFLQSQARLAIAPATT